MRACMAASTPGVSERDLECVFEQHTRRGGAARLAYPPVVGGGSNGCIVHYSRNDQLVPAGRLVSMDAGVELHGYVPA